MTASSSNAPVTTRPTLIFHSSAEAERSTAFWLLDSMLCATAVAAARPDAMIFELSLAVVASPASTSAAPLATSVWKRLSKAASSVLTAEVEKPSMPWPMSAPLGLIDVLAR